MSTSKPNIIFILADDLGYADVSCYGRRDYDTPHIDRLAAEGVRCTHAYANSPVCSATRTAIMTGRYQYRLPLGLEEPVTADSPTEAGLPPSHPTLPSVLREAGYTTTLIGKWHLGAPPLYGPLKSGYQTFYGFLHGAADYFNHDGANAIVRDNDAIKVNGYKTDLFGDRAVEFIEGADDSRPYLISLHFNAPHWPWEGPRDREAASRVTNLRHYDGGSLRTYGEMVQSMDANIGRVLQALRRTGRAENTIVILTSDNGGERFSDMWPFSGEKGELLEGGLRIPAIIRWPARIAAGRVSSQRLASMDWMPTLLAAAGNAPSVHLPLDGLDLLAEISCDRPNQDRMLFWRYKAARQRAVLDGRFKYLSIGVNKFLFDIEADPRERANLKDCHPLAMARLKSKFAEWDATMLPERSRPAFHEVTGDRRADRYGLSREDRTD